MEELESVTGAYRTRLVGFKSYCKLKNGNWAKIYSSYDTAWIGQTRTISRPCTSVLRHLISIMEVIVLVTYNSDHRVEIKTYLEDYDQFNVMMEDLNSLSGLRKSY